MRRAGAVPKPLRAHVRVARERPDGQRLVQPLQRPGPRRRQPAVPGAGQRALDVLAAPMAT
jgi:hypothetical protein